MRGTPQEICDVLLQKELSTDQNEDHPRCGESAPVRDFSFMSRDLDSIYALELGERFMRTAIWSEFPATFGGTALSDNKAQLIRRRWSLDTGS